MAITLAQLIDELRRKAGIQSNAFFDDVVELPGYIQDGLSNTYDTIVKAWAPYFAEEMPFTLGNTGVIELNDIVNPTQDDITASLSGIPISVDTTLTPSVTTPLPNPATYVIKQFTVTVTGTTDTGTTTFTVKINGVSTGDVVSIPNGSTGDWTNTAVTPEFGPDDVVTIAVDVATPAAGTYTVALSLLITPVLHNPPFYKELGIDWLGSGMKLSVPRLQSFMNRNDGIYTSNPMEGDYILHYIPSCPILSAVVDLPQELERWKQMILLEAQITVYMKRGLDTSECRQELNIKKREIESSAKSRVGEPKLIPTRMRSKSIGRSFDILGSRLQVFPTIGNDNGDGRYFGGWGW